MDFRRSTVPHAQIVHGFLKNFALGIEYYGNIGAVDALESFPQQEHALYITGDLLNNTKWEVNTGLGLGLTETADDVIFKILVGRRVFWKK